MKRWLLFLIAAPAGVAVWSGWVGLGGMSGFGLVQPFPGIVDWHLNTAITLPVGVEAYGAYALGVWLSASGVPERARRFAFWSAIGSLVLGVLGQVAFHLLTAAHRTRAPWEVVVLVSCMPVVVLGCAAALTHLCRTGAEHPVPGVPAPVPEARAALNGHAAEAERIFAADIAAGTVPGIRRIRSALHVGQPKAEQVRAYLAALIEAAHGTRGHPSAELQPAQTQPSVPGDARRDP